MLSIVLCGFSLEFVLLFLLGLRRFVPVLIIRSFWLGLLSHELALSDVNVRSASGILSERVSVDVPTDAAVKFALSSRIKRSIGLQYRLLPDLDCLSGPNELVTLILPLLEDNRIKVSLLDQHSEDILLIFVLSLQNVTLLVQYSR
jgi:hypothetical protein